MNALCYYSKLPDDMQVLIVDILGSSGYEVNELELDSLTFEIKMLPIEIFPEVPMWTDYRDMSYASAMTGETLPPVIICKDQWIDGRNRVWALRKMKATHVPCMDLSNLIGSYPFPPIAYLPTVPK